MGSPIVLMSRRILGMGKIPKNPDAIAQISKESKISEIKATFCGIFNLNNAKTGYDMDFTNMGKTVTANQYKENWMGWYIYRT